MITELTGLPAVEVTDEATSIYSTLRVELANRQYNPEACAFIRRVLEVEPRTLASMKEFLLANGSELSLNLWTMIVRTYTYEYARWVPEGALFEVTLMTDIELSFLQDHRNKVSLPAGTYLMRKALFQFPPDADDGDKHYPWLVTPEGQGMHLGVFLDRMWETGDVSLHQL